VEKETPLKHESGEKVKSPLKIPLSKNFSGAPAGEEHGFVNDPERSVGLLTNPSRG
jgi:hypothetical protein